MDGQRVKRFSDFAKEAGPLDGTKVKIEEILDKEILVIGCRIKESKYSKSNSSKCLTIQFVMNEKRYIVFTGSAILVEQMEKYQDEIPFLVTIRKIDKYYTFS